MKTLRGSIEKVCLSVSGTVLEKWLVWQSKGNYN